MTTAVAVTENPTELALLKAVGFDRLSVEQRTLALRIADRYELDPLLKHLVMIEGRPYITRDGLLHVAHRSGKLDGIETTEPAVVDGFWRASCSVYRNDMTRPFTYTGRYPTTGGNQKYAPEMAVKVAEVMALRRAFDVAAPTAEERWDAPEADAPSLSASQPSLAERAAAKAAEIERPPIVVDAGVDDTQDVKPAEPQGAPVPADSGSAPATLASCGNPSPFDPEIGCDLVPGHAGVHRQLDERRHPVATW